MSEKVTFVCSYKDCTEELGLRKQTCPLCGQNYCEGHSFPKDHDCERLKQTKIPKGENLDEIIKKVE